jgi:anti-sigma factor RsiW
MTDRWTDRLSAHLDGELSREERAALDEHLGACAACREDLARLGRVREWAAGYEGTPPRRDPWPAIRAAIGPARAPDGVVPLAPRSGRPRTVRISLPFALAASLALATVAGGASWWAARVTAPAAVAATPSALAVRSATNVTLHAAETYGVAIAELERALLDRPERLDSATVRILRQKLAAIDAAIGEALEALGQDPASSYLADHFADLMRRKLTLLRNVASTASFES